MRALCWHGKEDIRYDNVPDPKLINDDDIIIKVTATAICGSDLHIYNGLAPAMEDGDVLGHEFMGEVVEKGSAVDKLAIGDRVVVPFTISCGHCFFCQKDLYSLCDESNPNAEMAQKEMGHSPAGLFGYTHMLGGFAGGQAEYVRVPYGNVGPLKIESGLTDEQVLFLSDIFPTGYMGADNADIEDGDTVAVWGCGPVGQFAIQSAWMFGAGRVIAIDCVPERLALAKEKGKAEVINFEEDGDVYELLMQMTGGRGPDRCIDAVGAEAHGAGTWSDVKEFAQEKSGMMSDRPHVINEAIKSCRKGGNISVPGVYFNKLEIAMGPWMNKALTMRGGQTHMQQYMQPLLKKIEEGTIDPSYIITHRASLADGPDLYETFRNKDDNCLKVVMTP
jgi:threonine dehydrogenase-like Zn-dependent dehydrogenase